ncbi:MAG: sigma-70 family RNA polymerase sigma factor, partial [Verrucomicrobiota bacterium]
MNGLLSDRVLIRRFARQGDADAFSILMGRYADMVCTTCRRILGDETQAADAVQETFFQLAKDADRITGSLGSWLHQVATRRAVDVIRQNASRRRREKSYASDAVCRTSTWSEVEPAVDEALEELPENLREVLLLHFLQGRTTTQIAAAQGISQPTISRRMNEALELLRQILRERGVQAGSVPLQTVLLHSNYIAPEALRCGLGKIALAKATLTGA